MGKKQFQIPKILGVFLAVSVITACPELPEFEIKTVDLRDLSPFFGAGPPGKLEISNNAAYFQSGEINWEPKTTRFEAGDYTATFTLQAKPGFVFNDGLVINTDGKWTKDLKPGNSVEVSVKFNVKRKLIGKEAPPDSGIYTFDLTYLVPLPYIGGSPAETLNFNQFRGKIEWEPDVGTRGVFQEKTQYTATVNLTAINGYTFDKGTGFTHDDADKTDIDSIKGEVKGDLGQEATVTIKFPIAEQAGATGQDYIAVAGGEYNNLKSRFIYLFFKDAVKEIKRGEVYIRGVTVPSAQASDPIAAAYNYYGDKVWKIPLPDGIQAGSASFEIRNNSSVTTVPKSVLIHGDKPSTPALEGTITPGNLIIPPPVADGEPQTSVAGGTGYTGGDIDWWYEDEVAKVRKKLAAGATFAYGTVYIAEFPLTVKGGYRFHPATGWTCNGGTVESEVADRIEKTSSELIHGRRIITVVFPKTVAGTTIDIAGVLGVTAPATGETPATAITPTAQYTGTVSWNPAVPPGGTFAASATYTATITLSPVTGYTLNGVDANFFSVAGATATNAKNSGVIKAEFPATGPDSGPGATITFTVTDVGGTVTINPTGSQTITKPAGSLTLTATIPSGFNVYKWYVDGADKGSASSITVNAADYGTGGHDVILVIVKDGVYYDSKPGNFTVN